MAPEPLASPAPSPRPWASRRPSGLKDLNLTNLTAESPGAFRPASTRGSLLSARGDFFKSRSGSTSARAHRSRGWSVTPSAPKTFDSLAASEPAERLAQKWGAKEAEFREKGARCMERDFKERQKEAISARDGRCRKQHAEEVHREYCQINSGLVWKHPHFGGRRSIPRHIAGGRYTYSAGCGLFSNVLPLQATESELIRRELELEGNLTPGRPQSQRH